MARPREFDEDAVVAAAVDVFWRQGLEATSVEDLCRELGLSRSSLYAAFGGKAPLFLRALDRYREDSLPGLQAITARTDTSPLGRLAGLLKETALGVDAAKGCLNVNTATECGLTYPEAAERVTRAWDLLEEVLVDLLEQARAAGELREGLDLRITARFLLTILQGLRVVARVDPDPFRRSDTVTAVLAALARDI